MNVVYRCVHGIPTSKKCDQCYKEKNYISSGNYLGNKNPSFRADVTKKEEKIHGA